jgi:hypothetical protein
MPHGIKVETDQTEIVIKGIDKQVVGQVAAEARVRRPEPQKGVRYSDETVVLKNQEEVRRDMKDKIRRGTPGAANPLQNFRIEGGAAGGAPFEWSYYAQVIGPSGDKVLTNTSTLEPEFARA